MKRIIIAFMMMVCAFTAIYAQNLKPIESVSPFDNKKYIVKPLVNGIYSAESRDENSKEYNGWTFYSYTTPETTILVMQIKKYGKNDVRSNAISNPWEVKNVDGNDVFVAQDEYTLAYIVPSVRDNISCLVVVNKNDGTQYEYHFDSTPDVSYTSTEMMAKIIDKL